jgi:hypothetical protein
LTKDWVFCNIAFKELEMKSRLLFLFVMIMSVGFLISCGDGINQPEYHHIFPNEYRSQFEKIGINVDDFTIKIPFSQHRGAGTGIHTMQPHYNDVFGKYLESNGQRFAGMPQGQAQKEVRNYAEKLLSERGLRGEYEYYRYNPNSQGNLSGAKIAGSGAALTVGKGGFLTLCSKISKFFLRIGGNIVGFLIHLGITVAGIFGIKLGEDSPFALILGIVTVILAIFALIGLFLFFKWLIAVILALAGGGGAVAANNS